jgi:hypothetical protein
MSLKRRLSDRLTGRDIQGRPEDLMRIADKFA